MQANNPFRKGYCGAVLALTILMICAMGACPLGAQEPVGTVSGRVTGIGGGGIADVRMDVYTIYWNLVESVTTDGSGNYVGTVPAGSYYIATFNQRGYIDVYYPNAVKAGNSWPPAGVVAVNVIIGADTPNIDFTLSVGGSISGRVTDNSLAGIENVSIDAYDESWRYVNSVLTDSQGYYTLGGLPGGSGSASATYYLATSNQQGYVDEYYRDITKAGVAWPPASATPVSVTTGAETRNINMTLSWGGAISGRVIKDSDGTTGIEHIEVLVYDTNWNELNSTVTDSAGNYMLQGLPTDTYYVGTWNQLGYIDKYFSNVNRIGSSSPPVGYPVHVTTGSVTGNIDFSLAWGGWISGRVTKSSGGAGIGNVQIQLYGTDWIHETSALTDPLGDYTLSGLPQGNYYLRTQNYQGYVDEYYDNAPGTYGAILVGVTAGSGTEGINFGLEPSGSVSGRVVNASNLMGIPGVMISAYNGSGDPIQNSFTNSAGNYVVGSLPAGTYSLATFNQQGYGDKYFDTLVSVTGGVNTPNINFALILSGSISGRVANSNNVGLEGVDVYIYGISWTYVMRVSTDSSGNYTAAGLLPGRYYVTTVNDLYLDEYYNDVLKASSPWPPTGATDVSVGSGTNTPGINFTLALGGSISGQVTNVWEGMPVRNIQVRAYGAGGKLIKSGRTDVNGNYRIAGLLAGNYLLSTWNDQGYMDVYYRNTLGSSTATSVAVGLGLNTPEINFSLPLIYGNSAPTITEITPNSGDAGTTVTISRLAGTGFFAGAAVKLTRSGSANINASSVVVVSPTQITCTFNLTGAAVGQWNVMVTNVDTQSAVLSNGFRVSTSSVTVSGITPGTGAPGSVVPITDLSGTGFLPGASVKLTKTGSADINATSVVVSPTQVTCTFNLTGAAVGQWNVVVTNTDGQSGTLSNGFTVSLSPVTVGGIAPGTGLTGTVVNITNLSGTGFLPGASVKLTKAGSAEIHASSVEVISSTKIACTVNLAGAAAGQWNVVVTNPDSGSGTLTNGFTVSLSTVTVSGIAPGTGAPGSVVPITDLSGTGFLPGTSVKLTKAGSAEIHASSVEVISSTKIACTVNLAGAAVGQWNVVVTNPDGGSGTLTNGFTVSYPAPTVSGITPNSGVTGATIDIANLSGTGFLTGASVKLNRAGSADIVAAAVVVTSPTQITCTLNLAGAAIGQWNVVVTNPDSQTATLYSGFSVTGPAPTVSGIRPSSGAMGATVYITALSGTGFLPGASVKLTKDGTADIHASSVVVVSSYRVTCAFDLTGAALGRWNVVVTNSDGQSGGRSNAFTVDPPAPTVVSVIPGTGVAGTTVQITSLSGTGFLPGALVKLTKAGNTDLYATSVMIGSPTQITCTLNLAGAAAGQWNVTVTNTDGKSGTLTAGFTVTSAAPTIASVTPQTGLAAATVTASLLGTGFLPGASVKLTKAGSADINGTSIAVVSATQITCAFNLSGAALGQWNAVVTNSDTQSAVLTNGFAVISPAPTIANITPNKGVSGTTVAITDLAGTGFLPGAAVKLTKRGSPDIDGTSVSVVSSTRITCAFNLPSGSIGTWNVKVINADNQSATRTNRFTVTDPAPTVSGITPNTGVSGTTVNVTDLSGTGFLPGATVKITKAGSADIYASSIMVVSTTRITCSLNLAGADVGHWNVVVTNSDTQAGVLGAGFSVTGPAPTVVSITPGKAMTGTTVNITNLAGTGFLSGASVRLTKPGGTDINATSVAVVSSTKITCAFELTGAAVGKWNVVVTNSDGQVGQLSNVFTVSNPAPKVTGLIPSTGMTGTTVNISNLAGTGFLPGAMVTLTRWGGTDINATSVAVVSSTQITCTLDLTGAAVGAWNLKVMNTDGQYGQLSNAFTVVNPAPTVIGITPSVGSTGAVVTVSNLAGTGFLPGATIRLTRTGCTDITASSVAVLSPSQITCNFNLTGAATGEWNVVLANSDMQSGTLSNGFTVTMPAPVITSITPRSGAPDTTVNISSLTGSGFLPGATVKLTRTGSPDINANSVVVVSPTKITCSFDLTGATVGRWDVVVTNPDGQSRTRLSGFTVTF
jgi:hypothetical protein